MYLMDSNPRVNNRKWNLGQLGLQPVRLPNLGRMGASSTAQNWRRLRGLRGLGDDAGYCTYFAADGVTPETFDFSTSAAECAANGGSFTAALNTPAPVGRQNPSPVTGSASNGGITTVLATTPSTNPLDYTSPQAAIAANLDPATVYSKWTAALARFPSSQAAIDAGVPAGVVNQLWQQSYQNAANKAAAAPSGTIFGLSPTTLLAAGAGLFALSVLGGGRRRR